MGELQTIIFNKEDYDYNDAIKFLAKNNFKTNVDITDKEYRFRQREPNYKNYVTKKIKPGLMFVIGFSKKK